MTRCDCYQFPLLFDSEGYPQRVVKDVGSPFVGRSAPAQRGIKDGGVETRSQGGKASQKRRKRETGGEEKKSRKVSRRRASKTGDDNSSVASVLSGGASAPLIDGTSVQNDALRDLSQVAMSRRVSIPQQQYYQVGGQSLNQGLNQGLNQSLNQGLSQGLNQGLNN